MSLLPLRINEQYQGLRKVHSNPPVFLVKDFLTADQCDFLISRASEQCLIPANVVQSKVAGKSEGCPKKKAIVRNNMQTFFERDAWDTVFFTRKLELLTTKPRATFEAPQIGKYCNGQFYRPHLDVMFPETEEGKAFCANGGNRVCTVLCYLNTVKRGGRTSFPNLKLRVRPTKGSALVHL
jgi:prolyl 4-hydroxylase